MRGHGLTIAAYSLGCITGFQALMQLSPSGCIHPPHLDAPEGNLRLAQSLTILIVIYDMSQSGTKIGTKNVRNGMQGSEIAKRLWRPGYIAIMIAVFIAAGSLMPVESASSLPGSGFVKHAFSYGVLSFFIVLAARSRVNAGILLLCVFGYGLALESIQPMFGRDFGVDDLVANTVGSLIGLGVALVFGRVVGHPAYGPSLRGSDQS